ncbi:formate/nitrite transporter family protein [Niallia alba]|uniref:formate/nitrite transporter family protein n=1 Tax=Niallia alba TaxID=2729105 RepID=UPI0003329BEC|nr:formate/nitrite transporter family protein [Niallia alba]EOR22777.1 formate/nitrite transporter [Niallia nealsonii AAU1]MED3791546.1 formate/nitrite transporter family protein [Niallia alba]
MDIHPIDKAINYAIKKKETIDESFFRYFVKAILAGIYIGFALMLCYRLAQPFFDVHSPATYMMTSLFFGLALVLISYGGGELFTGNTMAFAMSTLSGATSWKDTIYNWVTTYLGNLVGALFFAILIYYSGLFSLAPKTTWLMDVANSKMSATTVELFIRGILCNWLVCLAIWIPMNIKGDVGKIIATILIVFSFMISGYEHSVANMALFSIALIVPHPETITITNALHNLIPVTIGNIVGGAFFVGALNLYIFPKKKKVDKDSALRVASSRSIAK